MCILLFSPINCLKAEETINFSIPRTSADSGLKLYVEQAGRQILFPYDLMNAYSTNAVQGVYDIDEALQLLLNDTGLEAVSNETGTLSIHTFGEEDDMPVEKKTIFGGIAAVLASVFTVAPGIAQAQQSGASVLEEIVVTAQKREESLQDVPISITTFSGEQLRAGGIQRLEYLATSVPNFHFSQTPTGNDQLFVRGTGAGLNFGFEMSVGQVIDGFFYGRSRIGRAAFLDLERVEILKGPQGAALGKNNSAGAINLTSAKPTDEFEGSATVTGNIEGNNGYGVEGYVSGPLSDNLKGRAAIRYDNFDGFFNNTALGTHEQSTDDFTGRISLLWEPREDLDVALSYQRVDNNREGHARELYNCGPVYLGFLNVPGVNTECDLNFKTQVNGPVNGEATPDEFTHNQDMTHLTINWDLGKYNVTSLTGYMQYDYKDFFDGDSTPTEDRSFLGLEDYSQWLQEFRLSTNNEGGRYDFRLGAFFLFTDQTSNITINFVPANATRVIQSNQDSTTTALFGDLTFYLTDTLDITFGARYTYEKKDLFQEQYGATLYTNNRTVFAGGPAANVHSISPSRSENNFSPTVDVRWHPNDEVMLYGSVRKGFKGGGYDMLLSASQADALSRVQFGEEEVLAYEIGVKAMLLNRTMRVNAALFRNEFEGLQQSSFVAFGTFQVGNAAEATTQGLEVGVEWQPVERLNLTADFAYLDAEYESYQNGPCYPSQDATTGCFVINGGRVQDLSGRELPWAPEIAATMSATYTQPLSNGMNLTGFLQLTHSADQFVAPDLNPVHKQNSYQTLNARLALSNAADTWEVALIGRNLTDKLVRINGLNATPDSYAAFLMPPRLLELQATLRF